MNREEALTTWAPEDSVWSRWTKAVLFSFMPDEISDVASLAIGEWQVPLLQDTAMLVDLAGAKGVEVGISLAYRGYRPIPLYNACPNGMDAIAASVSPVVDVIPIMRAIATETSTLKAITLPSSAPPVFLLDANRSKASFSPEISWFDNRSIVRHSDLPSVAFLMKEGIKRLIVIRTNRSFDSDLQSILLSWQEAGMTISTQAPDAPWAPLHYVAPRPSLLNVLRNKLLLRFGYRLNSTGSFGRFIHGSAG